jgi:hypothetical protein
VTEELESTRAALRVYTHLLLDEETDLSFADFGVSGRPYTSPKQSEAPTNKSAPGPSDRERFEILEHETGFEPATLTLAT